MGFNASHGEYSTLEWWHLDFTPTLVELTCALSYHYFAHLPVHDVPFTLVHCAANISVLGNVRLSVSVCSANISAETATQVASEQCGHEY